MTQSPQFPAGAGAGGGGFAAVDVGYPAPGVARAAIVVADGPDFGGPLRGRTAMVDGVAPYQAGEFYLRELPPLRAVLADAGPLRLVVIDGYADLDPGGRPGLGSRVHDEFGVPVIGVAKSPFRTATHALPVLRGTATRPLYVTAAGLPAADAARLVAAMAGQYRLPDALRTADALSRGLAGADGLPAGPPAG